MTPKNEIIEFLKTKGVMTVGFCNAEPMLDYAFFVKNHHKSKANYFDVGFNEELEDESFYNPKVHLPKAKSIITILLPYNLKLQRGEEKPQLAISKASVFSDYHIMMNDYLDVLLLYIEETYNKKSVGFCDTGPLNDKAVLLKTGTVQILRNSLLYHKDYGSRFYIGYLITELEIEGITYDNNLKDEDFKVKSEISELSCGKFKKELFKTSVENFYHPFCEKCGRCANACPNKAIEEHGHLTSHRCISFLTQSKLWEELPEDLTLKGYVYGCDICQLVCPLNGKNLDKYNYENVIDESVSTEHLKGLTNREFKELYNKSSAGWIGKKRFIRNAKWNDTHK